MDDHPDAEDDWAAQGRVSRQFGNRKRDVFLEHLEATGNIADACVAAGWQIGTYQRNLTRSPAFRARVEAVKAKADVEGDEWNGGFAQFRKVFFGMDSPPFHLRIIDIIERAVPGTVTLINTFPESGKTTLLTDYDCEQIARHPNIRITVGSEKIGHSRKIIKRIKGRMTDRRIAPHFIHTFGPFHDVDGRAEGKPWAADYLTVKKSVIDEQDYTVEGRGMMSAIAGTRCDLLQVDDPQSRKSLNLTEKLVDVFRQDWLSRPGQNGRTVVLMARCGEDDFSQAILDAGIVTNHVCFPAISDSGEPLWPEVWPLDKLEAQRRLVGEDPWWRNYMQQPRKGGNQTFTEAMLHDCRDPLLSVLVPDPDTERWRGPRIMGLDPALGGRTALVVADCPPGRLSVRSSRTWQGLSRTEQILELVDEAAWRYRPQLLVVEENAFQRGLVNDDRLAALAARYSFRTIPHQTGDNKHDENYGVAAMATDFLVRRIDLPYADEPSQAQTGSLETELMNWRPHVKGARLRMDQVMALWFAWLQWRQGAGRIRAAGPAGPQFRRQGLPWRPTTGGLLVRP